MKNAKVILTRAETEALISVLCVLELGEPTSKDKLAKAYPNMPVLARSRVNANLCDKIWSAWADTHPEEGPFK